MPLPFVVRSSVVSCETTTLPSFVTPTSSSSMSAPALTERLNAYSVFDGNSSSPPWWAMFSTRRSSHGLPCAAAGAAGRSTNGIRSPGRKRRMAARKYCSAQPHDDRVVARQAQLARDVRAVGVAARAEHDLAGELAERDALRPRR